MANNGQLSDAELATIPGGRLRKDAAEAFNAMYHEQRVAVRDSYRPLGQQGDAARGVWSQWAAWEKYMNGSGNLAAHPGTSNHGWGTAVDLATPADRAIVDRIGAKYGWSKSWSDAQSEWWHILYQPGHFNPTPPVLKFGDRSFKVLGMSSRLRNCGYLSRPYFTFNRPVHGAVVAFQKKHRLTPDGQVGPVTDKALTDASNACKRNHRKEV
jgi:hypothetical protein